MAMKKILASLEPSGELSTSQQGMALDVGYPVQRSGQVYHAKYRNFHSCGQVVLVIGIFHGQKESDKWIFLTCRSGFEVLLPMMPWQGRQEKTKVEYKMYKSEMHRKQLVGWE